MNRSEPFSAVTHRAPPDPQSELRPQPERAAGGEGGTRFDPPHPHLDAPAFLPQQAAGPPPALAALPTAVVDETREAEMATRESLLHLQAADLIERLQLWSSDLDARESQLNARLALQDHRERQFRLWAQSRRADLEASIRAADERAGELREAARRLAIAELSQQAR
ncbi:hypothetical protein [Candidatus Laterigemmans baculatus]|uniref:hypothetical protein n=1 Tax=Candidatus Laterigemmans baculatus TaxID=2770505 RepID=UPI0013DC9F87|nr:hypothetical protein [Candidatus Laterigemmans baculatus]